jgi:hypothetical protein
MIAALYILVFLWIVSVFSFARMRLSLSGRKNYNINPASDPICLIYLKISGTIIFIVVCSLIGRM